MVHALEGRDDLALLLDEDSVLWWLGGCGGVLSQVGRHTKGVGGLVSSVCTS